MMCLRSSEKSCLGGGEIPKGKVAEDEIKRAAGPHIHLFF